MVIVPDAGFSTDGARSGLSQETPFFGLQLWLVAALDWQGQFSHGDLEATDSQIAVQKACPKVSSAHARQSAGSPEHIGGNILVAGPFSTAGAETGKTELILDGVVLRRRGTEGWNAGRLSRIDNPQEVRGDMSVTVSCGCECRGSSFVEMVSMGSSGLLGRSPISLQKQSPSGLHKPQPVTEKLPFESVISGT